MIRGNGDNKTSVLLTEQSAASSDDAPRKVRELTLCSGSTTWWLYCSKWGYNSSACFVVLFRRNERDHLSRFTVAMQRIILQIAGSAGQAWNFGQDAFLCRFPRPARRALALSPLHHFRTRELVRLFLSANSSLSQTPSSATRSRPKLDSRTISARLAIRRGAGTCPSPPSPVPDSRGYVVVAKARDAWEMLPLLGRGPSGNSSGKRVQEGCSK